MDFQLILLFLVPVSPPLPEVPGIATSESLERGEVLRCHPFRPLLSFPHSQFEIQLSQPCYKLVTKQPSAFQLPKLLALFAFLVLFILAGECLLKIPLLSSS